MTETDEKWMHVALNAARDAATIGEVPIGACIVDEDGDLLAVGHNLTITESDPTAHAEIVAIRRAAKRIENYRLVGTTVYSTIEPCAMCAGAIVTARVKRLVFGSRDERFGGIETHFRIGSGPELNHRIEIASGVMAVECRALMQDFFKARR
jgi:tRNA(adenine34) deaminase